MKLTKWSKNKESYAEKSNNMNSDNWKECERNVQLYKELNAKHIDVERGRNTIINRNKDRLFENISQYNFNIMVN